MTSFLTVAGFFAWYLACSAGALWLGKGRKQDEDRAVRHGNSGEKRVARTLTQAGYTLLSDLTVQHGRGTTSNRPCGVRPGPAFRD